MATWDEVRRLALAFPHATEHASYGGLPAWRVKDRAFAWERPLRESDRKALGVAAPDGPILAAYVADVGAKAALVAEDPKVYFTTPHFDGFPAVMVRLDRIPEKDLEELLVEAWLVRAPKRLAKDYLHATEEAHRQPPGAGSQDTRPASTA